MITNFYFMGVTSLIGRYFEHITDVFDGTIEDIVQKRDLQPLGF